MSKEKPPLRLSVVDIYARIYARRNRFEFVRADRGCDEFVATRKTDWPEECLAFAVGNAIFWRNRRLMQRITILRHEMSHVADHRTLGGVVYAILYWGAHAIWGYELNPFELRAARAERRRKQITS